uniref:Uncharacterized protein n=1 Tax=viral metagenome TaxID=1070528 RepID=A0A6C0JTY7_9ZZZZ
MANYLNSLSNKLGLNSGGSRRKLRKGGSNLYGAEIGGPELLQYKTSGGNHLGVYDDSDTTMGGKRKRKMKRKTKRKRGGTVGLLAQASVPFGMIGLQRMVGKNMSRNQSKRRNRSFRRN